MYYWPRFLLLLLLLGPVSCVDEDYFGKTDSANILSIEISGQNGTPVINTETDSIHINIANGTDMGRLVLKSLELSSFATSSLTVGDTLNFSQGALAAVITAESGRTTTWIINAFELGSQPQIENFNFNIWHQQGSYLDPGESDSASAWGTSNPGATFGGLEPNVQRLEVGPSDYAAKLTTRFTFVGSLVGKPIAAGSIFTGDFMEGNISFDDPQASINFGIPFTASPKSFSVDYRFTPGATNINADQEELAYPDASDLYILLERRENGLIKRVATAWQRIEKANNGMETITIPFFYGELPAGTPAYMLPTGGDIYAAQGETPTHIKAVFSSSANGNLFEGAEGSELIIDNVILNY